MIEKHWQLFRFNSVNLFKFWMSYLLRLPTLYIITGLSIIFFVFMFRFKTAFMGEMVIPQTSDIVNVLNSYIKITVTFFITFFAGELIFASKECGFKEFEDAMPTSNFVRFFSMYTVVMVLLVCFMLFLTLTGVLYQLFLGLYQFKIGLYMFNLCRLIICKYLSLTLLFFFIHNLVRNKYLSYIICIGFILSLPKLGLNHGLLYLFHGVLGEYTEMNGFGTNIIPDLWFSLYWFLIMLLLSGFTVVFWNRGASGKFIKNIKQKTFVLYNVVMIPITILTAGFIFYNTNILNIYVSEKKNDKLKAQYEINYKHFELKNQPRIYDINLIVDIYPETETAIILCEYRLRNIRQIPIDTLFIDYRHILKSIDVPGELISQNDDLGVMLYRLNETMAPGDTLTLRFEQVYDQAGFSNNGRKDLVVRRNGTFFTDRNFVQIGYDRGLELSGYKIREKHSLPPKDGEMPNRTDPLGLQRSVISYDADWLSFEAVVSTSADQIALTPGELINSWTENERNYYNYRVDKTHKQFCFLSARYDVFSDTLNIEGHHPITLEIYHHPPHMVNLQTIMNGMKDALVYNINTISDYPHNVLRIAEMPDAHGAIAFSTLMPFRAHITTKFRHDQHFINYLYSAHETTHQWWAYMATPAFTKGAKIFESFCEFIACITVQKSFPDKSFRNLLKQYANDYFKDREKRIEPPLTLTEYQSNLYYWKGALVLHATSRLLGEDVFNNAIKEYFEKTKYTANPYTTTIEFMDTLDPYVPDSLKTVIDDIYNKVIIFHYRIENAKSEELDENQFITTIDLTAEKKLFNDKGSSKIMDINQWIEIGLSDSSGEIFHIAKHLIHTKENNIQITTDQRPQTVIIDPYFTTIYRPWWGTTSKVSVSKN